MANKWFYSFFTTGPKKPCARHFFGTFSGWAFGILGDVKHMSDSVSPFSVFLRNRIFQFFDLKASKVKKLKNAISQENGKWGNWISHMFYITQGAKCLARETSEKWCAYGFFCSAVEYQWNHLLAIFGLKIEEIQKFQYLVVFATLCHWCLKNEFFFRPTI